MSAWLGVYFIYGYMDIRIYGYMDIWIYGYIWHGNMGGRSFVTNGSEVCIHAGGRSNEMRIHPAELVKGVTLVRCAT
jgi:hypothetical protein